MSKGRVFGDRVTVTEGELPGGVKTIRLEFINDTDGKSLEAFTTLDGAMGLHEALGKAIGASLGLITADNIGGR